MIMLKKVQKRAFTLVEMLIVIVIIWLLMSALIPKISGMQAKGRDVSRKASLNNINTALVSYQTDRWSFPDQSWWKSTVDGIADILSMNMTQIPKDPKPARQCSGVAGTATAQEFMYMPIKRNWITNASAVLMACTEEWGSSSNRVYKALSANAWVEINSWVNSDTLMAVRCDAINVNKSIWATNMAINTWSNPCQAPMNDDILRYMIVQ